MVYCRVPWWQCWMRAVILEEPLTTSWTIWPLHKNIYTEEKEPIEKVLRFSSRPYPAGDCRKNFGRMSSYSIERKKMFTPKY